MKVLLKLGDGDCPEVKEVIDACMGFDYNMEYRDFDSRGLSEEKTAYITLLCKDGTLIGVFNLSERNAEKAIKELYDIDKADFINRFGHGVECRIMSKTF